MRIMVLNDGETYSDLDGCRIMEVPDTLAGDDIEGAIKWGEDDAGAKVDCPVLYTFGVIGSHFVQQPFEGPIASKRPHA